MLAIEDEIKNHESLILELRKEGTEIVAELDSWRTNLPFGLPTNAAKSKASIGAGTEDLKVGLRLSMKRALAKALAQGTPVPAAITAAEAAGQRFLEKKGLAEMPSWVGEWLAKMANKTILQPQVEMPVVEGTEVAKPELTKTSKKRKK